MPRPDGFAASAQILLGAVDTIQGEDQARARRPRHRVGRPYRVGAQSCRVNRSPSKAFAPAAGTCSSGRCRRSASSPARCRRRRVRPLCRRASLDRRAATIVSLRARRRLRRRRGDRRREADRARSAEVGHRRRVRWRSPPPATRPPRPAAGAQPPRVLSVSPGEGCAERRAVRSDRRRLLRTGGSDVARRATSGSPRTAWPPTADLEPDGEQHHVDAPSGAAAGPRRGLHADRGKGQRTDPATAGLGGRRAVLHGGHDGAPAAGGRIDLRQHPRERHGDRARHAGHRGRRTTTVTVENLTRGTSTPVLLDPNGGFLVLVQASATDILEDQDRRRLGQRGGGQTSRASRARTPTAASRLVGHRRTAAASKGRAASRSTSRAARSLPARWSRSRRSRKPTCRCSSRPRRRSCSTSAAEFSSTSAAPSRTRYVDVSVPAKPGDTATDQWLVAQALTLDGVDTFNMPSTWPGSRPAVSRRRRRRARA